MISKEKGKAKRFLTGVGQIPCGGFWSKLQGDRVVAHFEKLKQFWKKCVKFGTKSTQFEFFFKSGLLGNITHFLKNMYESQMLGLDLIVWWFENTSEYMISRLWERGGDNQKQSLDISTSFNWLQEKGHPPSFLHKLMIFSNLD